MNNINFYQFKSEEFKSFLNFFNSLSRDLEYPSCEGKEDAKRVLKQYEEKFLKMMEERNNRG